MNIGKLAKHSEVNLETIRFYEREGLLPKPPRSAAGYRVFPVEAVRQVRFIKHAKELGFSLKEIKELLTLRIDPGSTGADVRKRAKAKIADIDEKMKILHSMKKALTELTAACHGKGSISKCSILETLTLINRKILSLPQLEGAHNKHRAERTRDRRH